MAFGVSFGDTLAVAQLCAEIYQRLGSFSKTNNPISGLRESVPALGETFGRFQQADFNHLEECERDDLDVITKESIDSINSVRSIIDSEPSSFRDWWRRRNGAFGKRNTLLLTENLSDINAAVGHLHVLLLQIEARRAPLHKSSAVTSEFDKLSATPHCLSEALEHLSPIETERLRLLSEERFSITLPRICILIILFFATFVALSCFLGIYFTLDKRYGYSMGDAFTLAGWVVAVGAFISSALLAYHHPRCKCWDPPKHRHYSRRDGYELQNLVELQG